MTSQRVVPLRPGSLVASLRSSIWYYLALIKLSSIPSLSPPPALLLSSFPLLLAKAGTSERLPEPKPLLFSDPYRSSLTANSSIFLSECFLTYHHLSHSLLFTLSFSPILSPLPVCWSPSVSHSLPHSIINFNLRAGLNGTIRERSMLLIWMPARLDLSTHHQRKGEGKKQTFFSSSVHHIHTS